MIDSASYNATDLASLEACLRNMASASFKLEQDIGSEIQKRTDRHFHTLKEQGAYSKQVGKRAVKKLKTADGSSITVPLPKRRNPVRDKLWRHHQTHDVAATILKLHLERREQEDIDHLWVQDPGDEEQLLHIANMLDPVKPGPDVVCKLGLLKHCLK